MINNVRNVYLQIIFTKCFFVVGTLAGIIWGFPGPVVRRSSCRQITRKSQRAKTGRAFAARKSQKREGPDSNVVVTDQPIMVVTDRSGLGPRGMFMGPSLF